METLPSPQINGACRREGGDTTTYNYRVIRVVVTTEERNNYDWADHKKMKEADGRGKK